MSSASTKTKAAAWSVHALTLSGLLWATLATVSLFSGAIGWMWLWLGVALIVDGVDGTLARKARVKEVLPWFDGSILDIVIDYLTWTFIPALFMIWHLPLGPRWLAVAMGVLVLISSMFCYANANWKSTDHYFIGFPAAWNVVAVVMYVLATPGWFNVVSTITFAVLTLVPTHYTHPFRVKRLMAVNISAILLWIATTGWLVAIHPVRPWYVLAGFWLGGGWFLISGIARTVLGKRNLSDTPGHQPVT